MPSHELYAQLVDQQVNGDSSATISVEDKVVKKKKKSAGAEALEVIKNIFFRLLHVAHNFYSETFPYFCGGFDLHLQVVVIGLSHHNAKVEVREKLAIPEANWSEASAALCEQYDSISEVIEHLRQLYHCNNSVGDEIQ